MERQQETQKRLLLAAPRPNSIYKKSADLMSDKTSTYHYIISSILEIISCAFGNFPTSFLEKILSSFTVTSNTPPELGISSMLEMLPRK